MLVRRTTVCRVGRFSISGVLLTMLIIVGTGCVGPFKVNPPPAPMPPPGPGVVDVPRPDDDFVAVSPGSLVETWVVHTRACSQEMDSNPWPSITVAEVDDQGGPLRGSAPETLLERMRGRTCVILIHGAGYSYKTSTSEALQIRSQLELLGGFAPDALFIIFDWPSERTKSLISADLNEKARLARVASYHLARFLQAAPEGTRICLMGQSNGGRIALTTAHLLSGKPLKPFLTEPGGQLTSARTDLRLRCVALESASGHTWLNPGGRNDEALPMFEAMLNLCNSGDYALGVYVLGRYTGAHSALGLDGLKGHDRARLGPLANRVEQIDQHSYAGRSHTLFTQSLTYPGVANRIAAYTSWQDVSEGGGKWYTTKDLK